MEPSDQELFDDLKEACRSGTRDVSRAPFAAAVQERFEVLDERDIGAGAQGTVVRARDKRTGAVVALKVLHDGRRSSLRDRYRFEREVDLAATLCHPSIVAVDRSYVFGDHVFYAMEWIDGEPLDHAAPRGETAELGLVLEICDAVAHAHQRGIIHRDLKPANILVDAAGRPHVLDFGLAHGPWTRGARVTATGEFMGTLGYAAPEQLQGGVRGADTRTDVYAIGVMLYELLCGERPHDTDCSLPELIERVRHAPPVPPLPADLRTIVLAALQPDPGRRYQSVAALAADIRHYLANEPIDARPAGALYRARKWLARHRRAVAICGGIALLVTAVTAAIVFEVGERRQRRASRQVADLLARTLSAESTEPDILEGTAARLQHTLEDAPEVRAALRFTIGETYRRRLMHDRAVPHLRAALTLFEEVHGREHRLVADCLESLGRSLGPRRDRRAVALLERALAIRQRVLGAEHERTAVTKRHLGTALLAHHLQPEPARARALFREALATLTAVHGEDHVETALTRQRLDALAGESLSDEERELRLRRDLDVFERARVTDPGPAIDARIALAWFLTHRERYAEARALLVGATQEMERAFGAAHVPRMLRRMARLELARGEPVAAEHLHRRALARDLTEWRERSPGDAERLGALVEKLSAVEETAPFRRAFAILIELEGPGRYELASHMHDIAEVLEASARRSQAIQLLDDSLVIRCRRFAMDCPHRLTNLFFLGRLHLDDRRWGEARALLAEAYSIVERIGGAATARGARVASALGAATLEAGDLEAAEKLLLDAHRVFAARPAATGSDRLGTLRLMGEVFTRRGETAKAAALRAQAADLAKKIEGGG